jgi:hypothetical protein
MTPDTKYASRGGVNIAYQAIGDGPFDKRGTGLSNRMVE